MGRKDLGVKVMGMDLTGFSCNVVQCSPVAMINIVNSPKKAYISDWFSLRYDTGLRDHMLFSVVFSFFLSSQIESDLSNPGWGLEWQRTATA